MSTSNHQAFFSHIENYLLALKEEDDDNNLIKSESDIKSKNEQIANHYYNLYSKLTPIEKPLLFNYQRLNHLIQNKYDIRFNNREQTTILSLPENLIKNINENNLNLNENYENTNEINLNNSNNSNNSNFMDITSNDEINSQNVNKNVKINSKIFEGIKILLILGKYMTKQQANIHLNNIKKRGGICEIYNFNLNNFENENFNFIICGNENIEKIKEIYPNYLNCKLLIPKFIIDCIKYDKLITKFGNYEITNLNSQANSQNSQLNSQHDNNNSILMNTSINSNNSNNNYKKLNLKERQERFLNSFVCVSGAPSSSSSSSTSNISNSDNNLNSSNNEITNNGNEELIEMFEKLYKHYNSNNDTFRSLAYKKSITILKKLNFKITKIEDINTIKGIGDKVKEKIKEYLKFGKMKRVEGISNSFQNQIIQEFTKIWGVGQKTAFQLYSYGYRSINEIDKSKLNSQQLIGLKYFYEFQQRIPKCEVEKISKIVQNVCTEINPFLICETCGSYRRGKLDSGDVDILITLKIDELDHFYTSSSSLTSSLTSDDENNENQLLNNRRVGISSSSGSSNSLIGSSNNCNENNIIDGLLQRIVKKLEEMKVITDVLSISCKLHLNQDENDTFMGVYYLPEIGIHRRIDIKIYRREHFAFALLYFTGSDHFNRSMRLLCRKKGYSLSDKSLCINTIRDSKSNRIHDGTKIHCKTENDIFNFIGIPYKEPKDRDV